MTESLISESEINPRELEFGINLATKIAEAVKPAYGIKERDVPINKVSHDYNYAVDKIAEDLIKSEFEHLWNQGIYYGFVTEDQGLVLPPGKKPERIFMIDPVDGSRTAQIGAENATVTMVVVDGDKENPTFADINFAITHAIKENKTYICEREKGVYEIENGKKTKIEKRENASENLKDASLVYETFSMSPTFTGIVAEPLVREISFKTEFPSGSYSALTLVRGQNDVHVDLRKRLTKDYPKLPVALKPNSKSVFPMDVAAGWLMIKELGGKVTDAKGESLDDVKLWDFDEAGTWSSDNEISWVGAINEALHAKALQLVEKGFEDLDRRIKEQKI